MFRRPLLLDVPRLMVEPTSTKSPSMRLSNPQQEFIFGLATSYTVRMDFCLKVSRDDITLDAPSGLKRAFSPSMM